MRANERTNKIAQRQGDPFSR